MKCGFYPKMAWEGMRKNRRMYLPYILTFAGMAAMYYIVIFLQFSKSSELIPGADSVRSMLGFGGWVMALFSCIFLFYTNSFLMKLRRREFGLYNILGMGKGNIARLMLCETIIIYFISVIAGLVAGIALSKLSELLLINIVHGEVSFTLDVSLRAVGLTLVIFGIISVLLLLNSLRQLKYTSAARLLKSENEGERPPKGNWVIGILGVMVLIAAYYIAVTIDNPMAAMGMFFIAVLMVIVATYLIMVSGSVLFCRVLQKNKKYYYKSNHFVSVSSMAYRMKRNGAGLASICILATMVLVMLSTTTALYSGAEDTLNKRYPRDINAGFSYKTAAEANDANVDGMRDRLLNIAKSEGINEQDVLDYKSAYTAGSLIDGKIETDVRKTTASDMELYSGLCQVYFIPLDDYNAIMGKNEMLNDGEALLYAFRTKYDEDELSLNDARSFKIKKQVDELWDIANMSMNFSPTIVLIVPDIESATAGLDGKLNAAGENMVTATWEYDFNTNVSTEKQLALDYKLREAFSPDGSGEKYSEFNLDARELHRDDFYGLYGGIFFLGLLLSIVFVFATVLIIYYKQISEGYEDCARFEIMCNVGMTKKEIRRSINSQLLTVFFLPLIGAGVHLVFAFPMIRKILMLFNLFNVELFIITTAVSFIAFALFYTIIYRVTSGAYYGIVSGADNRK